MEYKVAATVSGTQKIRKLEVHELIGSVIQLIGLGCLRPRCR